MKLRKINQFLMSILIICSLLLSLAGCVKDDVIETSCGEDNIYGKKILVVYDTKHGSTSGVAAKIGNVLCELGSQVDIRLALNVDDISEYDAVIVGSAIYQFNWLLGSLSFLKKHIQTLSSIPVAYFIVCSALMEDTPENQEAVMVFVNPVLKKHPEIVPVDIGRFGGAVDFSKLNLFEKLVFRIVGITESEDWRDWEKITVWAEKVDGLIN